MKILKSYYFYAIITSVALLVLAFSFSFIEEKLFAPFFIGADYKFSLYGKMISAFFVVIALMIYFKGKIGIESMGIFLIILYGYMIFYSVYCILDFACHLGDGQETFILMWLFMFVYPYFIATAFVFTLLFFALKKSLAKIQICSVFRVKW